MRIPLPLIEFTVAAGVLAGVVNLIMRTLDEALTGPGTKAWNNRVQRLRDAAQKFTSGLVPWDAEMLRLLSLNRGKVQKPGWFGSPGGGVFTTIYHEPVLAYVLETGSKNQLLLARTSTHELVFRLKEKETEIWVDRQPLGVLVGGALLAAGKGGRLLAQFDPAATNLPQTPLNIGDRPAAALTNPGQTDSPMPRALTLLRDLTPEEETIALALAVLRMVKA